jgi:hypothetical protein
MLDCFVIKKSCSPPTLLAPLLKSGRAGQNSYDDSFKGPSKKEGSGRAQWMIQSIRPNTLPEEISNEKVVQKRRV